MTPKLFLLTDTCETSPSGHRHLSATSSRATMRGRTMLMRITNKSLTGTYGGAGEIYWCKAIRADSTIDSDVVERVLDTISTEHIDKPTVYLGKGSKSSFKSSFPTLKVIE